MHIIHIDIYRHMQHQNAHITHTHTACKHTHTHIQEQSGSVGPMALTPPPSVMTPRNQRTPSIEPPMNGHAGAMRGSFNMDMHRPQAPGSNNSAHAYNTIQPQMQPYNASNGMSRPQPAGQMLQGPRGPSPGQIMQDPRAQSPGQIMQYPGGQSPGQMLGGPPQSQPYSPRNDMSRAGLSPRGSVHPNMQQVHGYNPATQPREGSVSPMGMYPGSQQPQNGYNAHQHNNHQHNNLRNSQQLPSAAGPGYNGAGGMPAQSPNGVWPSNAVSTHQYAYICRTMKMLVWRVHVRMHVHVCMFMYVCMYVCV
jgi:hypothetical protein